MNRDALSFLNDTTFFCEDLIPLKRISILFVLITGLSSCGEQGQETVKSEQPETDFCMHIHRNDSVSLSGTLVDLQGPKWPTARERMF